MARPRKLKIDEPTTSKVIFKEEKIDKPTVQRLHVVCRGDNIQTIAQQYNVSVDRLIRLNGTDKVTIGQVVRID